MAQNLQFYSHGKLLISGEYFVLDGALALAVPTKLGQHLEVVSNEENIGHLHWQSKGHLEKTWLDITFSLPELEIRTITEGEAAEARTLQKLLLATRKLKPAFLDGDKGLQVTTQIEFDRQWGLGSSSTLVNNMAEWAEVDAHELLKGTFGGSGYDLACANAIGPILYWLEDGEPHIEPVTSWPEGLANNLYFVYLGKKQNSRDGIKHYRDLYTEKEETIAEITRLTKAMVNTTKLEAFEALVKEHENVVAKALNLPLVKEVYFQDYWGSIKSLGAWGGDFVMVTSAKKPEETSKYFRNKGFQTIFAYKELIIDAGNE